MFFTQSHSFQRQIVLSTIFLENCLWSPIYLTPPFDVLGQRFFRNNFSLPIYTHLENCYDMTIILINVSTIIIEAWEKHQKQHKCLIQHPELINMIFDLQNFVTSRPIPSQDPKVLSLHDPISSRSKKNYPSFFLSSTVIIMANTVCFD